MKKIIFLLLPVFLFSNVDVSSYLIAKKNDNSFITQYEYGKMLYNNPRGVSCKECHGSKAKGKLISKFKHKTKKETFNCQVKTQDISSVSLNDFRNKLDANIKVEKPTFEKDEVCKKLIYGNIMPKYFLTQEELNSIYFYIRNVNEHK